MQFLIVNPCPLQNDAIAMFAEAGLHFIETTETLCMHHALELYRQFRHDGIIVDSDLLASHMDCLRKLKLKVPDMHPTFNIVLVDKIDAVALAQIMAVKPAQFVHKSEAKDFFLNQMHKINPTEYYLSPELLKVIGQIPDKYHAIWALTLQELNILGLILQGLPSKLIADAIGKPVGIVENLRKKIKEKLEIMGGKNALVEEISPLAFWILAIQKRAKAEKMLLID